MEENEVTLIATHKGPWYTSKPALIGAGVLLFLLLAWGGMATNKIRVLELEKAQSSKAIEDFKSQISSLTKTVQVYEQATKETKSRYRNLLVSKNPLTGEPLFDKDGKVLLDVEEGSAEVFEEMEKRLTEMTTERDEAVRKMFSLEEQLQLKSKETVKPARSQWGFTLGYGAPVARFTDFTAAAVRLGAVYHFDLMGLDVGLNPQLGVAPGAAGLSMDRAGEVVRGEPQIELRP